VRVRAKGMVRGCESVRMGVRTTSTFNFGMFLIGFWLLGVLIKCHWGKNVAEASVAGATIGGEQLSREHLSGEQLSLGSKCRGSNCLGSNSHGTIF
jgi:hypothetical protein